MEIVDTPAEAAEQELAPLIVREPLEAHLDEYGIGSGAIEAERIGEGHSNITYLVRRGGERVVLRRLLSAVENTSIRVPKVLLACDDESILGVPFYVMEYLEGSVITSELPPALDSPGERRRIGEELIDALAEIHAVDWRACGLEGYGKGYGYLERQLRRFNGLWEHNKTRELPVIQELGAWLDDNLPESPEPTIVHGDYRLGNTMYANDAPARLIAIFDWELSTIGDPLADLGYMTVSWTQADDDLDTMFARFSVTHREGFLTRDEMIARYEERTGRSMSDLRWYQALALWKAAVFMEGNYKRSLAGTTDDPFLKLFDEGVPKLAEAALTISRQPPPSA
jgi:aminoglycoside phosphotransferase (APT) family kinase protein